MAEAGESPTSRADGCPSVSIEVRGDVAAAPAAAASATEVPRKLGPWQGHIMRNKATLLTVGVVATLGVSACLAALVASAIIAGAPEERSASLSVGAVVSDVRRMELGPRRPPAAVENDTSLCLDAQDGEMCFRFVQWMYEDGKRFYPEKYINVTKHMPFEEAQELAHSYFPEICPKPCRRRPQGSIGAEAFGINCDFGHREEKPAHAGCFVVHEGRLLAERLTYDGWKLDIPGGQTNWREPARCTAYRETYEETGYLVAPRELLAVVRNDFHLYRCELIRSEPVKGHDREISWVGWMDASEVSSKLWEGQWRFPEAHRYAGWLH
mmetsp:Transcript_1572/g.4254  ORF Transcript_1572/g.4254 Transcript_1572/m.4254 type:complete len:325 (+) Transcript_1572:61-1035(+)